MSARALLRSGGPGRLVLAAISAVLVAVGWAAGWRGVDLPAQLYRVDAFRSSGFSFWDSQWYGGHWTLDYSVIYPAMASTLGVEVVAVLSAAVATSAFDRLVVGRFGPRARLGSAVFACSVIVETAIGQLAFFTGEAFALACLWCLVATRRRWGVAGVLAVAATLSSPLAGAFTALAVAAWGLEVVLDRRGRRPGVPWIDRFRSPVGPAAAVAVAALVPIAVTAVLFPGQGPMPYPVLDWAWEAVVAAVVWQLAGPGERVIRTGVVVYLLVTVASVSVPSALGGNVGRIEDAFALPLAVAFIAVRGDAGVRALLRWLPRPPAPAPLLARTATATGWVTIIAVLAAFTSSQWSPASAALTTNAGQDWTTRAYFSSMTAWLDRADRRGGGVPLGRVEVVPTEDHWEADYVAPVLPLARGWERQLDISDNALFYDGEPITDSGYLSWLRANGVTWVALSDAPNDPAAVAEAALVASGVPGLHLAWRNAHWRVYRVAGPGIVSGPARLTAMTGGRFALATPAGRSLVRVRWAAHWHVVSGAAGIAPGPGGWLEVVARRPGRIVLASRLEL